MKAAYDPVDKYYEALEREISLINGEHAIAGRRHNDSEVIDICGACNVRATKDNGSKK